MWQLRSASTTSLDFHPIRDGSSQCLGCLGVAEEFFLPFGSLSSLAFGYGHQRDGNEYDLRPSAVPPGHQYPA